MEYIIPPLLFLIFFLLSILSRSNPFRRVLRPTYRIVHNCLAYHRPSGSHGPVEIEFVRQKSASPESFRTAIADAVYSYPNADTLIFKNLVAIGSPENVFNRFYFRCIDLSKPLLADTPYLDFFIEQLAFPADIILLPKDLKRITLPPDCGTLIDVYITSPIPIPVYHADVSNCTSPIRVRHDLVFHVPNEQVHEYQISPTWSALSLIDEYNNTFSPVFLPYTYL